MEILKKVVLWTYKQPVNGEYEIRIRLTLHKEQRYFNVGHSCSLENWDEVAGVPVPGSPDYRAITRKIEDFLDEVDFEIKLMKKNGHEYISLSELISRVKKYDQPVVAAKIYALSEHIEAELRAADKIGYADTFHNNREYVLKKVFGEKDRSFVSFNKADFRLMEDHLNELELKPTTMSAYLRTFYRVWNIAIKEGMCPKDHHPSKTIKFKPYKKYKTSKRAISAADMKLIESYEADYSSRVYRNQQIFLFSYYCRGINYNDIVKLKEKNFNGDILSYKRSKNGRYYDFKMHSKAKAILDVFRSYPIQSSGGYVFPILMAEHETAAKIDARVDSGLKDLNEDLKVIKEAKNIDRHVTSYVARHSFATNLKHKKVDISIIQEAMGHETEEMTRTYLEEYDDELVSSSIEEALD